VGFWSHAIAGDTVRRAARVTAIVAPTLIVINHAACVWAHQFGLRCTLQCILTTVVPYAVSTYSSASAALAARRG
jgi:hypothetical protein